MTISDYVKTPSAALVTEDLLRSSVDVLLGVTAEARAALAAVNVHTVFDLAVSPMFATAVALRQTETDASTLEARVGGAATDSVVPPAGVPVGEWSRQGLSILAGLDAGQAAALQTALDTATVRDLALWPPYTEAKAILADALGSTAADSPGTPADLLPRTGVYPTECVFFTKLLLDLAPQTGQGAVPIEQAGAIDLGGALAAPTAFQRLATGALATFRQSWYSEGVTLGQLLHSLTLAPGESTRVAMLDWSRQVGASITEQIDEREQLSDTQIHNRALTEVADATAREFQSGSSDTLVESASRQGGGALGLEIGPLALGGSSGGGSSTTTSMSASSSFGVREMGASLAQNINDRTQQNASSARSRRASVVSEVSQDEHESITTRIVTNYNHMHALNVQYFEIVQAYRVTTELDRVQRCLFVPLELLDFHHPALVDRVRPTLAGAALTGAAFRQLTSEYGAVELIPRTPKVFPGHITGDIGGLHVGGILAHGVDLTHAVSTGTTAVQPPAGQPPAVQPPAVPAGAVLAPLALAAAKGWDPQQVIRLGSLSTVVPLRQGSDSVFVPDDARLLSLQLRAGQATRFQVRKRDDTEIAGSESSSTNFVLGAPVRVADLGAVAIQNSTNSDVTTTLALNLQLNNTVITLDVPIRFRSHATVAGLQDVLDFGPVAPAPELIAHLEANRLHYSRAVYARLDAAAIAGILAKFTYRGVALTRVVDPEPVATTANFLVFRMNVPSGGDPDDPLFADEQQAFATYLKDHGLDSATAQSEIVPLPTGGVFAEAVLGRFNAAEKIDLQRFWNWQDSPIPIAAPDIAPVSAASRAEADTTKPGQLGTPILSVQAPTTLPAAAGVAAILAGIQNANTFRDMSGLAQTAALAQAAVAATGSGATAGADQAAKNLFTVMDENTQRMRIAADLAASMYGGKSGQAGGGTSAGTTTERGGQVNAAQSTGHPPATAGTAPGAPSPAAAAPARADTSSGETLQDKTLAQQSGSAAADIAQKVVAAATTPEATTPAPTAVPPKSKPKPAPSTPPAAPVMPLFPNLPVQPVSFHVRVDVYFDATEGIAIAGPRQMSVSLAGGMFSAPQLLVEAAGFSGQSLFAGFTFSPTLALGQLRIDVSATPTAQGGTVAGSKPIQLPSDTSPEDTKLTIRVQPVIRRQTFTVPSAAPLVPDLANLEQQITAAKISQNMRVGDPKTAFDGDHFVATITFFTGELIIKQIL